MKTRRSRIRPPIPNGGHRKNQLRIIGGCWRSRQLEVISLAGLRPTSNRMRETLFNWLQNVIHGAHCLDLFAGSGALGIEAASRGAEQVVLVEKNRFAAQQLSKHIEALSAGKIQLQHEMAQHYLQRSEQPFDIIFLDPPFRQGLLTISLKLIEERQLLKQNGWVYLEQESQQDIQVIFSKLSANWQVIKETQAGESSAYLCQISKHLINHTANHNHQPK